MHEWLTAIGRVRARETLAEYCQVLVAALTREWGHLGLSSVLEIFISAARRPRADGAGPRAAPSRRVAPRVCL